MHPILITGSTGFIGSNTNKALIDLGYQVKPFVGDVTKVDDWLNNLQSDDHIFHCAGIKTETEKDFSVNTGSAEALFSAIKKSGKTPSKIVLVSSQAVYRGNPAPFTETMVCRPTTIYGKSKLDAEKISRNQCKELNIPLVILRYSGVLGPGIRPGSTMSRPLPKWIAAADKGEPITVLQDGSQTRDYVRIDDVVKANILAIEKLPAGIYNVGGGKAIKLKDLAEKLIKETNSKSKIVITGGKADPNDPKQLISDITKLRRFGWNP